MGSINHSLDVTHVISAHISLARTVLTATLNIKRTETAELGIFEQYERLPYGTLPFIIHTRTLLRMQGGTINNYAEMTRMLGF